MISLNIFGSTKIAADGVDHPVDLGFAAATGGTTVSGIAGLAQKVAVFLLSYNLPFDVKWGTYLWKLMTDHTLQTVNSVIDAEFATAATACLNALSADTVGLSEEERLDSVTLLRFEMDRTEGTISLVVEVTAKSGAATILRLPTKYTGGTE